MASSMTTRPKLSGGFWTCAGSSATHRQIVVSTTVVDTSLGTSECLDNKIPFVFFPCLISVFSLPQDHQPVPACHPPRVLICLPSCLESIIACQSPVVPYYSRPHYNKPLV
ncbi:unnamed protein product [Arctogadus glacialis]